MTEQVERPDAEAPQEQERSLIPMAVFGVTALAFLVYLAFGTVEARIWRYGRLYFEDRTIRHVWAYFGDRLPEMPGQPVIQALYWISLAVIVVGAVAGLWLFLIPDDDDAVDAAAQPGAEHHA